MTNFVIESLSGDQSGADPEQRWCLIAVGDRRAFSIRNGRGATPMVTDASIVRIRSQMSSGPNDLFVELEGIRQGQVGFYATLNGKSPEPWSIYAADKLTIRLACHLVKGKLHTTMSRSSIELAIQHANSMLTPQANVELVAATYDERLIEILPGRSFVSYGGGVLAATVAGSQYGRIVHNDASVDINAYFVSKIHGRSRFFRKSDVQGLSYPGLRTIFIEDLRDLERLGVVIAHEAVHAMGADHLDTKFSPPGLMDPSSSGNRLRLSDTLYLRGMWSPEPLQGSSSLTAMLRNR